MPTQKPRITITMDSELFNKIEDFRFKNKYKNQTQAILDLIKSGFNELESYNKSNNGILFHKEAINMAKKYRDLDDHGREMVDFVLEKEYDRTSRNNTKDYLMPIAAHNDNAADEEQQRLMQKDIDEL